MQAACPIETLKAGVSRVSESQQHWKQGEGRTVGQNPLQIFAMNHHQLSPIIQCVIHRGISLVREGEWSFHEVANVEVNNCQHKMNQGIIHCLMWKVHTRITRFLPWNTQAACFHLVVVTSPFIQPGNRPINHPATAWGYTCCDGCFGGFGHRSQNLPGWIFLVRAWSWYLKIEDWLVISLVVMMMMTMMMMIIIAIFLLYYY